MQKFLKIFSILSIATTYLLPSSALSKTNSNRSKESAMYYQKFESEEEFESYETTTEEEIYDPLEKYNRKIYSFNDTFDRYFLEHVAKFYREGVPKPARISIRNFLNNISLPVSAVNSLLQGNVNNGLATFSNFLINSTIGLGGIFDIAGEKNIRYKPEDLGQTLGHYGMGSGAYFVIPFFGPSSIRDFSGWSVDKAVNPLGFNLFEIGGSRDAINSDTRLGLSIASGIDSRESLLDIIDDIRKDSFDPYATVRSAYLQKRAAEIKN